MRRFSISLAFVLIACSANAQIFEVAPNSGAAAAGNGTFLGPFANAGRTYQLLINSNQLTNLVGLPLDGLTFRLPTAATAAWPTADVTFTSYDIYLSESVAPADRSLTFVNNIVGTQTQVRSGSLTISANDYPSGGTPNLFGSTIAFNSPWLYSGGHLLVEIRHTGFTGTSRSTDAFTTAAATGYGTDFSAAWTSSYTGTSGSQGNISIVQLRAVPEPTWLALGGLLLLARFRLRRTAAA